VHLHLGRVDGNLVGVLVHLDSASPTHRPLSNPAKPAIEPSTPRRLPHSLFSREHPVLQVWCQREAVVQGSSPVGQHFAVERRSRHLQVAERVEEVFKSWLELLVAGFLALKR